MNKEFESKTVKITIVGFSLFHNSYGFFFRIGLMKHQLRMWQSIIKTSTQNLWGKEFSHNIVLVMSCRVWLLHTNTIFYRGDLGAEKLKPRLLQKVLDNFFSFLITSNIRDIVIFVSSDLFIEDFKILLEYHPCYKETYPN